MKPELARGIPGAAAPAPRFAGECARAARPPLFSMHDAVVMRAGREILRVDDFSLAEGEHVAVLGPNGAGKSTFIQLLTREIMPLHRDEPPLRFCGQARPMLADIKARVGVVSATMHDQARVHLSAIDIVCGGLFGTLGLPHRVKASDAQREAAYSALSRVGVADVAERDMMTLSTGQARRVLIARELVGDPQALVFDEPCTGLDPEGMYHVRDAMGALAAEGRSIVLVTHYPEDIIPAIGRVMLIKDARIVADGPKREVLTGAAMSSLFGVPLEVERRDGWYTLLRRTSPAVSGA